MSAMTLRMGKRASKIQGGEDVDILRSPSIIRNFRIWVLCHIFYFLIHNFGHWRSFVNLSGVIRDICQSRWIIKRIYGPYEFLSPGFEPFFFLCQGPSSNSVRKVLCKLFSNETHPLHIGNCFLCTIWIFIKQPSRYTLNLVYKGHEL